jgi:hypothetical protein
MKSVARNKYVAPGYSQKITTFCLCGHKAEAHPNGIHCLTCPCVKFEIDDLII